MLGLRPLEKVKSQIHPTPGSELIQNVGKVMVQGGGTFGTFMAIGTGIRC